MIRILLTDDHPIVRAGFRALIEREAAFAIVGECGTAAEMWTALRQLRADTLVLDLNLPGGFGLTEIPKLRATFPDLRIIVLSVHVGRLYVLDAIARGAHGYVTKGAAPEELIAAIRETTAGRRYLSSDIAGFAATQGDDPLQRLSMRERDVLPLLASGKLPKQIASELNIAVKTVYNHRANLLSKLELRDEAELIAYAQNRGLN